MRRTEDKTEAGRSRAGLQSLTSGLSAFRHRNYRLYWFGQFISLIGTWMQSVAQAWLVLQLTNSAFKVGLVTAFQFAPVLVLSMLGGVFADRRIKRRLLLVTQSCAALQAVVLGLLILTGHVQVYQVMALAAVLGLVNAFDIPTRQAFVVEMVGREDLMNAIAFNSSAFNTARIVGPAIGGVLVARFGVGPVFLINAASFIAVLISLAMIRESELHARPNAARESVWHSLQDGLRYVRVTPVVSTAVLIVGAVATLAMNWTVLLSVMAKDVFRIGSQGYGILMAALGIGSVLAALFLAYRSRIDPVRTMVWGAAGLIVLEIAFALSPRAHSMPLSIALLLGVGFAAISMTATANTSIQNRVPDELRGRVMSVYITVFSGTVPLGSLLAGSMAKAWGAPAAMMMGAGTAGLAVIWAVWRLRRVVESPAPLR